MVAVVRLRENTNSLEANEFQSMPLQPGNGATTVLRGLIPGTYTAEVEAIGAFYVQSANSGATDLLREPLVVPSGGKVDPVEVVLRDDGGHVGGSLQHPEQGARAMVLLVPERGSPNEIRSTEAPPQGTFGFDQVRPGDYFVLAFRHGANLEFRNPDVLGPYLSNAAHVTVGARQQVNVSLQPADASGQR